MSPYTRARWRLALSERWWQVYNAVMFRRPVSADEREGRAELRPRLLLRIFRSTQQSKENQSS